MIGEADNENSPMIVFDSAGAEAPPTLKKEFMEESVHLSNCC